MTGFKDMSRKRCSNGRGVSYAVVKLILRLKCKHPTWGLKKIRELFFEIHGIERSLCESTIALVLSLHGLSQRRKCRPGVYRARTGYVAEPTRPNEVWTFDFKGFTFQLRN